MSKHAQFIHVVEAYVDEFPDAAPEIAAAAFRGISNAFTETKVRASEIESALAVVLAKRWPDSVTDFVVQKLKILPHRAAGNWDETIRVLEAKKKPLGGG